MDRYVLSTRLVDGENSTVYSAHDQRTHTEVVIKIPKPDSTQTQNEASILPTLSHDHIIAMRDSFTISNRTAIVLDKAEGGDVLSWLEVGNIAEQTTRRIARSVLSALEYMHAKDTWHWDIKPDNILVMGKELTGDNVVLCDFGYAVHSTTDVKPDRTVGTMIYLAPEQIKLSESGPEADIWALGVTLYACLNGVLPFNDCSTNSVKQAILNGLPDMEHQGGFDEMSQQAADLIMAMLQTNRRDRITAERAMRHSWFDDLERSGANEFFTRNQSPLMVSTL